MWQSMSHRPVNLFHLSGKFFASTSAQMQLLWMFWPMSTPDRKQVCGYNIWSQERTILPSILFIFSSFSSVLDNSTTLLQQSWAGYINYRAAVVINNRAPGANIAPPDWQPKAVAQPPLGWWWCGWTWVLQAPDSYLFQQWVLNWNVNFSLYIPNRSKRFSNAVAMHSVL